MSRDIADVDQTPDGDQGDAWDILPDSCHACLIYDSTEQRDAIVPRYLAAGIRAGDLVRYFADSTAPEVVRDWLADEVLAAPGAGDDGPVRIIEAETAYCPDGRFEPQQVIDRMVPAYLRARDAGFKGVRTSGEMTWALRGIPGSDRLMEYEALINTVPDVFPHSGMCQYDARQFDGATLFRVLRVHPHVVAGGQIVRNPYYVRPEVVLAEMAQRS